MNLYSHLLECLPIKDLCSIVLNYFLLQKDWLNADFVIYTKEPLFLNHLLQNVEKVENISLTCLQILLKQNQNRLLFEKLYCKATISTKHKIELLKSALQWGSKPSSNIVVQLIDNEDLKMFFDYQVIRDNLWFVKGLFLLDKIKPHLSKYKKKDLYPRMAAKAGSINSLMFFSENQFGLFTTDTMDDAAAEGNLEIVKWLHENRSEGCSLHAINKACEGNHVSVAEFLCNNRKEGFTPDAIVSAIMHQNQELEDKLLSFRR
jgi:hypothetical protein